MNPTNLSSDLQSALIAYGRSVDGVERIETRYACCGIITNPSEADAMQIDAQARAFDVTDGAE